MTSNQKLILLCVATALVFFLMPWKWIAVLGVIVLLIFFRDPLWDFAQATAKAVFPERKPKEPDQPPPKPGV